MKSTIVCGFAIFCCVQMSAARVQLRLAGAKHSYEGRVEAFVNGKWGPISAVSWTKQAAQVVCRQMGFSGKVTRYTRGTVYGFPKTNRPVWLERISCKGTESHIDDCDHSGWVKPKRRLSFYNLAGVMCYTPHGRIILPPVSSAWGQADKTSLKVWLQGDVQDGFISEGFLRFSYDGKSGFVCAHGWGQEQTRVACGHIGYPDGLTFTAVQKNAISIPILSGVTCLGNEASLFSCNHSGFNEQQECPTNTVVWLECRRFNRTNQFKNSAKLKLRGAALPSSGRLEVVYKHDWANVCDDRWNLNAANVVCRSLGYGTAKEASMAAKYGQGSQLTIIDEIKCSGHENDISECKWTHLTLSKCSHFEDAGVECNAPEYQLKEVRLRGGRDASEGRVEVKVDGTWGAVCGDHWGIKAAMIVCRELGSNFAVKNISGDEFGVEADIKMSGVICLGDELSLTQCLHDDVVQCSSPDVVAGVRCTNALSDLALSIADIARSLRVDYLPLTMLQCAFEENCLASSAEKYMPYKTFYRRRLMRFGTKIFNYGSADYRPFAKKEDWIWHSCHKHYHSQEEFATYDLLTRGDKKKVAEGHKASFCLEDTNCLSGVDRFYNCTAGTQGISMNCFDDYPFNIDCQWIDVHDVPYLKAYVLHVNINPRFEVPETDYDNNVISCDIFDHGSYIHVESCGYDYCTSGLRSHGGNANKACCVFPFIYRGKWYETCTTTGFSKYWCSTTQDYHKEHRWGLC